MAIPYHSAPHPRSRLKITWLSLIIQRHTPGQGWKSHGYPLSFSATPQVKAENHMAIPYHSAPYPRSRLKITWLSLIIPRHTPGQGWKSHGYPLSFSAIPQVKAKNRMAIPYHSASYPRSRLNITWLSLIIQCHTLGQGWKLHGSPWYWLKCLSAGCLSDGWGMEWIGLLAELVLG